MTTFWLFWSTRALALATVREKNIVYKKGKRRVRRKRSAGIDLRTEPGEFGGGRVSCVPYARVRIGGLASSAGGHHFDGHRRGINAAACAPDTTTTTLPECFHTTTKHAACGIVYITRPGEDNVKARGGRDWLCRRAALPAAPGAHDHLQCRPAAHTARDAGCVRASRGAAPLPLLHDPEHDDIVCTAARITKADVCPALATASQ